jgi:hypothetical protein
VSIHEKRAPFRESLVDARTDGSLEEVWFAGVHSDVGGTFTDKLPAGQGARPGAKAPDPRLSTIALKWIIEGAIAEGLLVRPRAVVAACAVTPADAASTLHRRGPAWILLGTRRRKIPAGASVHSSVQARAAADPGFKAPPGVVWADPDWAGEPRVRSSAGADQ